MKRVVLMMVPALICGIVFTSCGYDKTKLFGEVEGIYSGTYTVKSLSSVAHDGSGTITIKIQNGKYACIGIPHNQVDISGSYSINKNKIIFEVDVWKTDFVNDDGSIFCFNFDTRLIPQGEYHYIFDGNKLRLSKVYDDYAHYEYDLKKK